MNGPFQVVPFSADLMRTNFCSLSEPLNQYLRTQVSQDIKRRIASCFVALDADRNIVGYYTLASASVNLADLPEKQRKKLPRYPSVPAVLMGRLAVDKRYTGRGVGSALLANALVRVVNSDIAAYALIVEAKNQSAVDFYLKFGFLTFSENSTKLFYPLINLK